MNTRHTLLIFSVLIMTLSGQLSVLCAAECPGEWLCAIRCRSLVGLGSQLLATPEIAVVNAAASDSLLTSLFPSAGLTLVDTDSDFILGIRADHEQHLWFWLYQNDKAQLLDSNHDLPASIWSSLFGWGFRGHDLSRVDMSYDPPPVPEVPLQPEWNCAGWLSCQVLARSLEHALQQQARHEITVFEKKCSTGMRRLQRKLRHHLYTRHEMPQPGPASYPGIASCPLGGQYVIEPVQATKNGSQPISLACTHQLPPSPRPEDSRDPLTQSLLNVLPGLNGLDRVDFSLDWVHGVFHLEPSGIPQHSGMVLPLDPFELSLCRGLSWASSTQLNLPLTSEVSWIAELNTRVQDIVPVHTLQRFQEPFATEAIPLPQQPGITIIAGDSPPEQNQGFPFLIGLPGSGTPLMALLSRAQFFDGADLKTEEIDGQDVPFSATERRSSLSLYFPASHGRTFVSTDRTLVRTLLRCRSGEARRLELFPLQDFDYKAVFAIRLDQIGAYLARSFEDVQFSNEAQACRDARNAHPACRTESWRSATDPVILPPDIARLCPRNGIMVHQQRGGIMCAVHDQWRFRNLNHPFRMNVQIPGGRWLTAVVARRHQQPYLEIRCQTPQEVKEP